MLFLILILLFVPTLITAIFGIRQQRKKHERAIKKWEQLQGKKR